jgi:hypothetical protein
VPGFGTEVLYMYRVWLKPHPEIWCTGVGSVIRRDQARYTRDDEELDLDPTKYHRALVTRPTFWTGGPKDEISILDAV